MRHETGVIQLAKGRSNLKKARNKLELSQEEFAKLVGVSRSFYAQIENGDRNPNFVTAQKIVLLSGLGVNSWE